MKARAGAPVILVTCDDPGDTRRIERELRTRYEADYRIVVEGSAGFGLRAFRGLGEAGERVALVLAALFVLIGAKPRAGWLPAEIERGERGFIATGQDLTRGPSTPWERSLKRPPLLLETSMPGVFAVGGVRYRSVKRVASAVGESSIAIQQVHEYLGQV